MLILNEHNTAVDLNLIPDAVDMNFWVFENAINEADADYFCEPLIMLESFYAATIKLRFTIRHNRVNHNVFLNVPADHQLLIGEPCHGDLEINPVTSLSGRDFKAFSLNPMSSFAANFLPVDIEDVYQTTKWFMPKTKLGQLICVPLCEGYKPPCIYLVRDMPKSLEVVKFGEAW